MPVPDLFQQGLASGWKTYNGSRLEQDLTLEADVAIIGSGAGGGIMAVMRHAFAQGDDPPRQAAPVQRAGVGAAGINEHQLGRSTANVENQRRTLAVFQQNVAAEHGQPRLFLRGDDIQLDACFAVDTIDKGLSVRRPPARFGRHHAAVHQGR